MSDETAPQPRDFNAEAAKYRKLASQRKARITELETMISDLNTKSPAEASDRAAADRIAELEGKLRSRDHTDAFRRLATDKIIPSAFSDAYTLSGWQANTDEIDEAAMASAIDSLVESRPYLAVKPAVPVAEGNPVSPQASRSNGQMPRPAQGDGRGAKPTLNVSQPIKRRL